MIKYSDDKKHAYFNGEKFTKETNREYYQHTKSPIRLHQAVWMRYNGQIPQGHHIHHKDGDPTNNNIENLELVSASKHIAKHSKARCKFDTEWFENFNRKGRKEAKEWHKSTEGKKWHKKHYENIKEKLHKTKKFKCVECGKEYKTQDVGTNKFCSNKCKSKNRRKKGVDDVVRECVICGGNFKTNKYDKTKTCSRSCSSKLAYRNRSG